MKEEKKIFGEGYGREEKKKYMKKNEIQISEVISRQCFLTVLIIGYVWGSQSHSVLFVCLL